MNYNKIGKSICGLLLCTLMMSGYSAERKTGHETNIDNEDKIVENKEN